MLILTTIRPIGGTKLEFNCFNWDSDVPSEKHLAAKMIFQALERGNTVQSRRIEYRNTMHSTVQNYAKMQNGFVAA